jgi:hypothetical protein
MGTRWKYTARVSGSGDIDAPESTQLCRGEDSLQYRCGAKAANDLDAYVAGKSVSCTPISLDQHGRTVATCSVNGTDLGQWLVNNGLALDWPNYSHGMYDQIQREAEQAGRGIWSGSYVAPWLYRVCIRSGGRPADCSDDANHDGCMATSWSNKISFISPIKLGNDTLSFLL